MYFENFPQIAYDFDVAGNRKVMIVSDITRNVRFRKELFGNIELYDEYDIKDDETPEIISEKFYGTSEYHWVIMLVNERFDYLNDFPMSYKSLLSYVEDKYGVGNSYGIHHYINANGFIVSSDEPNSTSVTNLQYEEGVNESKRRIKIVSPSLISKVMKQFNDVI